MVVTGAHLPEQYVSGPSLGIICDLGRPNSDELLGMRFVLDSIGDRHRQRLERQGCFAALGTGIASALGTGIARAVPGRKDSNGERQLWGQA